MTLGLTLNIKAIAGDTQDSPVSNLGIIAAR